MYDTSYQTCNVTASTAYDDLDEVKVSAMEHDDSMWRAERDRTQNTHGRRWISVCFVGEDSTMSVGLARGTEHRLHVITFALFCMTVDVPGILKRRSWQIRLRARRARHWKQGRYTIQGSPWGRGLKPLGVTQV